MIHQYKNNGYNIVLDVNSGAIHVVDDATYDIIALYEEHTKEEILETLSGKYDRTELAEAYDEVKELADDGQLFTEDEYEDYIMDFKKRPTVVKALCLHIAHDCNLACRYCFAEEGEFGAQFAAIVIVTLPFLLLLLAGRKMIMKAISGGMSN